MATGQARSDATTREWRRPTSFHNHYVKYGVYGLSLLFVLWSLVSLLEGVTFDRIATGAGFGAALLESMVPPDTSPEALERTRTMMIESVAMAMVATVTGIIISIPVAFGAAENLVPKPVYALNRGSSASRGRSTG
jgi:phosphonate transport system permease protein